MQRVRCVHGKSGRGSAAHCCGLAILSFVSMSVALGNLGPSLRHPDKPQVPADFGFRPGKATFSCLQHTGEEPLKERPSNVLDRKRPWTFVSRAASALGSISTPAVMTEMKVVERHLKRDLIRCRCTQRMNLWLPEGNDGRKEESGSLGWTCTHTLLYLNWMTHKDCCIAQGALLNVIWQPG